MSTNEREARIIRCAKETFPHCRFIGKRYTPADYVNGNFAVHWGEWFEKGWFDPLEALGTEAFRRVYPDADAYIGLEWMGKTADGDAFFYWIGMFLPEDTPVPEGYECIDFAFDNIGVCYVQGEESKTYGMESETYKRVIADGMKIRERDGGIYDFERYACPRFTSPDENGEVILDLCYFIE